LSGINTAWRSSTLVVLGALTVACARPQVSTSDSAPALASQPAATPTLAAARMRMTWPRVRSFACQLQNLDVDEASQSAFDMIITDYSSNGNISGRYRADQVSRMQAGGRRKVLAYLSIGEAESYRFYWKSGYRPGQPTWLRSRNAAWAENYNVSYWDPRWRAIVHTYLDQILDRGYDGVFLDVVDAFERYPKRPQARREMAQLVLHVARHGRKRGGSEFGVFLNGGEGLIAEPGLLQTITGVAKEEIFVGLQGDNKPTPASFTRATQVALQPLVKARKLVLSIDYANKPDKIKLAHQKAAAAGYLEYVAGRGLDRLVKQPGLR
jgi:cysteinyl-tRNA synthetase, unknown class